MKIRVTKKNLRDFLESRADENNVAGLCGSAGRCPIAQMLIEQGAKYASVDDISYSFKNRRGDMITRDLPLWGRNFVTFFDNLGGYREAIPASRTLELLEKV